MVVIDGDVLSILFRNILPPPTIEPPMLFPAGVTENAVEGLVGKQIEVFVIFLTA